MASDPANVFARADALIRAGACAALVTVVRAHGSTPRSAGARMIVHPGGVIEGTIGGGAVEQAAIELALGVMRTGGTLLQDYHLTQSLGMCCGGSMTLFIEALDTAPRLFILGAGHVGRALAAAALAAGFRVTVADERVELLVPERFPPTVDRVDALEVAALPIPEDGYVVVMTHDHALDQRLVEQLLARRFRWLGLIGSQRKALLTRQRLAAKGFSDESIARVRSPVGVAIGAETPEEIAVSIVGELVAVRRGAALGGLLIAPDAGST